MSEHQNLDQPTNGDRAQAPAPAPSPTAAKKPTSPRKLASSRANGSLSQGPKTPAGHKACATAASLQITHGMLAKTVVIQGESEARFLALLDSYIATHRPTTEPELNVVYRMAIATWRQRRVVSFQTIDFNREIACQDPTDSAAPAPFRATLAFRSLCQDEGHSQALAHRYETTYERQYNRALRDLALLRDLSPKNSRETKSPATFSHGFNWTEEDQQIQEKSAA